MDDNEVQEMYQFLGYKNDKIEALEMILREAIERIENPHGVAYIQDLLKKHDIDL